MTIERDGAAARGKRSPARRRPARARAPSTSAARCVPGWPLAEAGLRPAPFERPRDAQRYIEPTRRDAGCRRRVRGGVRRLDRVSALDAVASRRARFETLAVPVNGRASPLAPWRPVRPDMTTRRSRDRAAVRPLGATHLRVGARCFPARGSTRVAAWVQDNPCLRPLAYLCCSAAETSRTPRSNPRPRPARPGHRYRGHASPGRSLPSRAAPLRATPSPAEPLQTTSIRPGSLGTASLRATLQADRTPPVRSRLRHSPVPRRRTRHGSHSGERCSRAPSFRMMVRSLAGVVTNRSMGLQTHDRSRGRRVAFP